MKTASVWIAAASLFVAASSFFLAAASLFGQAPKEQAATAELTVRLTAPLTTKLNRPGDLVVGKITGPADLAGGYLEGEIKDIHPGAGAKHAEISFQFHTLHASGKNSPVAASVVRIVNSKQQAEVDEDGGAIEQERGGASGPAGRLASLAGGLASRITKNKPQQAELTKLSSKTASLSLAPGSELTVQYSVPAPKSK
jgi:hypothetical protein